MSYEVHLSRHPGVVEEPHTIRVEREDGTIGLGMRAGSLFMRLADQATAEHVAATHEATARRSDDRHAWIRPTPTEEHE